MKKIKLILFIAVLSCAIFAQQQDEYSKGEISVGYSNTFYVDESAGDLEGGVTTRGVNFAGVYNIRRYIGIKAEVTATFSGTESVRFVPGFDNPTMAEVSFSRREAVNYFAAGVQIKDNAVETRWKPFGHAMVGVGQARYRTTNVSCTTPSNCAPIWIPPNETTTGFALVLGGGLDIKVNRRIDIRAVQLDIAGIYANRDQPGFRDGRGDLRFSTGVVFKF